MYILINHTDETAYVVTLPFLAPAWGYIQSLGDLIEYGRALYGKDCETTVFSPEDLYTSVVND